MIKTLRSIFHNPVHVREWPLLLGATALVGLGTGAVAAVFLKLYEASTFWPALGRHSVIGSLALGPVALVLIPTVGGLLCGMIIEHVDSSAGGTGTPELLHALRAGGTPIRARYTAWKTLASVFTTCSGGSAGPEGPMVTFGAGLAAWAGRRLRANKSFERTLTAAGAAAGFAAVFDAPAAGALFAVEVLLHEVSPSSLVSVIAAALVGTAVADRILGPRTLLLHVGAGAFLRTPGELIFYAALGCAAGLFGKAFIEVSLRFGKAFEKIAAHHAVRAALGGLLLGLLGLLVPQALGNSHHDLPRLFAQTPLAWAALLVLLFGKMIACPLTVSSGGSGGIFIPYLMMGATLGSLIGRIAHVALPGAGPENAYMIAGMGAVFASVTLAPITAGVLALEMTHSWQLALPAAVAVGVATIVARTIDPESLDTRKLLKKGIRLRDHSRSWFASPSAEGGS